MSFRKEFGCNPVNVIPALVDVTELDQPVVCGKCNRTLQDGDMAHFDDGDSKHYCEPCGAVVADEIAADVMEHRYNYRQDELSSDSFAGAIVGVTHSDEHYRSEVMEDGTPAVEELLQWRCNERGIPYELLESLWGNGYGFSRLETRRDA